MESLQHLTGTAANLTVFGSLVLNNAATQRHLATGRQRPGGGHPEPDQGHARTTTAKPSPCWATC
ncbi:MAG: hypothetical protein WKG07_10960 [Hymenobacter sp.]